MATNTNMFVDDVNITTSDELDAVNDILAAIGEPPVSSLDAEANADVANARRILNNVNRKIQSKGWTFNIENDVELIPDVFSKLIPWLPDFLSVMNTSGTTTYIKRGDYVYDVTNKTDMFDSSISVNMIRLRLFAEMPQCFRTWIVTQACRMFNKRFFGDDSVDAGLAEEEQEARIMCMEYELDFGQYNMLDGDTFVGGQLTR